MKPAPETGATLSSLPFRLGTTSYIYRADILANVRALQHRVDDIELVLYDSDEISNYPSPTEVEELGLIAERAGLTYTVHLPLDVLLGDFESQTRQGSVRKCLRAFRATAPLRPAAYIIHFQGLPPGGISQWLQGLELSVLELLDQGIPAGLLCVETLDYPFHLLAELLERHGLSICLDVGHIILYSQPLRRYLDLYLARSRVIHLHGVRHGRDHRHLGGVPCHCLTLLFSRLLTSSAGPQPVVTLEVFNEPDLEISQAIVERLCP